ncbi:CIC11C00000004059 [Sungouiella intermedia]|uniref:CIC11C00000004059 n=1 Tax=Sungouiella intermedia TaxID=45354 RepID=A0A1L0DEQ9_9ASCO|nr:CIC11C00000004059 [[Candida] intermedia]
MFQLVLIVDLRHHACIGAKAPNNMGKKAFFTANLIWKGISKRGVYNSRNADHTSKPMAVPLTSI